MNHEGGADKIFLLAGITPAASSRPAARQELRTVLQRILAAWSQLLPEQLSLDESVRGPVWRGQLGGHSLDISLSYAEDEGWIGLLRGGLIGVDAMQIQRIPEAEGVALHYLGRTAMIAIQQATDPPMAFAVAWTGLEARIKCLKRTLNEWSSTKAFAANHCAIQTMVLPDHRVVSMATTSNFGVSRFPLGTIDVADQAQSRMLLPT
jgi:hypothetical protein